MNAPAPGKSTPWPIMNWEIPAQERVAWFHERVQVIARRARAFELVMGPLAESGDLELLKLEEPLQEWDDLGETVFMYAGLCRDEEVEADAVPIYVEELAPVYGQLSELREKIFGGLGAKAAGLRQAEATTQVTDEQIGERILDFADEGDEDAADLEAGEFINDDDPEAAAPEAAGAGGSGEATRATSAGAGEASGGQGDAGPGGDDLFTNEPPMAVSIDELRMRQLAETKLLPAKLELADLLAQLPSEWVIAIFETLDLEDEEIRPAAGGTKSARYRTMLRDLLRKPEFVTELLECVGDRACAILKELIAARGMLDYQDVIARHGSDEADGYFWGERAPSGPLSRLRRTGLAYVGGWKGRPTIVVPTDLIPLIVPLLSKGR